MIALGDARYAIERTTHREKLLAPLVRMAAVRDDVSGFVQHEHVLRETLRGEHADPPVMRFARLDVGVRLRSETTAVATRDAPTYEDTSDFGGVGLETRRPLVTRKDGHLLHRVERAAVACVAHDRRRVMGVLADELRARLGRVGVLAHDISVPYTRLAYLMVVSAIRRNYRRSPNRATFANPRRCPRYRIHSRYRTLHPGTSYRARTA